MTKVDTDLLIRYMSQRPETPEGERDDVKIKHTIIEKEEPIDVVSMRNAIFMGVQPTKISFIHDIILRTLTYEGGTWMTDSAQEVWQMVEPLQAAWGDILVGGLGLGVFPHLAAVDSDAVSVTTVEIDKRICDLVAPYNEADIVNADLYEYLVDVQPSDFDFAFFDVWQPTGELAWAKHIIPLRRLCKDKIDEIYCWNEDEMLGQLRMNLPRHAMVDQVGYPGYQRVFQRAAQKTGIVKELVPFNGPRDLVALEEATISNDDLPDFLELFLDPSCDEWEGIFGSIWDEEHTKNPYPY